MEVIRVLHVVGKMHRAGLETFIMNVYRNIDRTKVQFDFITHYTEKGEYDDEIIELGGKIHRFSVMEDKNMFLYFKDMNVFLKTHKKYKIVHGHWTTFGLFYMYFAKRNGVKHRISHSHSSRTSRGFRGITKLMLSRLMIPKTNHYFTCSESASNRLYGKNSRLSKENKIKTIKNAIDLEKFTYNKTIRKKYRRQLDFENKFVIGHIGRLDESKNQTFIIDVFKKVHDLDENTILILIGTGPNRQALIDKVEKENLRHAVHFLGSRSDIPELLSMMDVFIFPSKYEALGIVAIEAQAIGLPTLVSKEIPQEAMITEAITSLSLSEPLNKWVDKIMSLQNISHIDTHEDIKKSGYDIKEQAKELERFYLGLN